MPSSASPTTTPQTSWTPRCKAQACNAKPTLPTERSSASPSKKRKNPCRASPSSAKPSPTKKRNSPKVTELAEVTHSLLSSPRLHFVIPATCAELAEARRGSPLLIQQGEKACPPPTHKNKPPPKRRMPPPQPPSLTFLRKAKGYKERPTWRIMLPSVKKLRARTTRGCLII